MAEPEGLQLDLRVGSSVPLTLPPPAQRQPTTREQHMARAQVQMPKLPNNLRTLGAVGAYVPLPPAGSQQTVIKGSISPGKTTGRFVQEYLAPHKGKPGREEAFFNANGTMTQDDAKAFVQRATPDTRQFRFSVSLQGHPPFLPMRALVEALMADVQHALQPEQGTRRTLDWLAAVQRDTANLHAHVVLRDTDQEGRSFLITNHYLREGLRFTADRIATDFLGPVSDVERIPTRAATPSPTPARSSGVDR